MKALYSLLFTCICLAAVHAESPAGKVVTNSPTAWPMFRGDAQGRGVAKCTLPDEPQLLWEVEIKRGSFEGTAAIVDGVVYIGDMDGEVRALDLETGQKKWEYPTESAFIAPAAVFGGRVYIGDMDGGFHCIDADSGEGLWVYETNAEIDGCANLLGENVLIGSQDATLYCLNAQSGERVWEYSIADQIRCTATLIEGHVFVAGCDSRLHVIDASEGKEVRFVNIGSPTGVTPAAEGERVYFGTSSGVFFCVDWKQGSIVWQHTPEQSMQELRSSPALNEKLVVFGGRDKRVKALNPADGKPLWTHTAKSRIDSSPVIVGDRIFVGCADGRLLALDSKSGDETWSFEARGGLNSSPAVAEERLVIASDDGFIYCFGEKKN